MSLDNLISAEQLKNVPSCHAVGWTQNHHYMPLGGQCGQSCPCCRFAMGDVLGACLTCYKIKKNKEENNKKKNKTKTK